MNSLETASLINLLGFTIGTALYFLLLVMVVRRPKFHQTKFDFLLLATAILGLLWNFGEIVFSVLKDFGNDQNFPLMAAISYSALGFLPSVVVHLAWKVSEKDTAKFRATTFIAYFLSGFAAILHFHSVIFYEISPSSLALQVLSFGSLGLLIVFLFFYQLLERKAILITALGIFAVSALHLSSHNEENSWLIELLAHQSSLPLALAILLQDYRFAFADLFLKRAISLILLGLTAFILYAYVAVPLLSWHETHDRNDVQAAIIVITLWMTTALFYSYLHQFAIWLVDKLILQRQDYEKFHLEVAKIIEKKETIEEVLDEICRKLGETLTCQANWTESYHQKTDFSIINFTPNEAEFFLQTADSPYFKIKLNNFFGGRKLLSDEMEMLEKLTLISARRIDALRVTHERCEQELQAQEFSKLATEAQLTALRSQINPHFLFNSLTTIGYLIQTSPEKAFQTLMRLTQLLRSLLRKTEEFTPLREEISIIESYLEIEQARFEERLQVKIEIPKDLETIRIPSLILQPLVENAVKHGISKVKNGGEVKIKAQLHTEKTNILLCLQVFDSGAGINLAEFEKIREKRVGLNNVEQRLKSHYGKSARLKINSEKGKWTKAEILFPITTEIKK